MASKETAFLLSFRAVAFELYAKLYAEKAGLWQKTWVDRGFDFVQQAQTQQYLEDCLTGVRLGIGDSYAWKKSYDDIYLSGDYDRYHYLSVELPQLPVVACGVMHIEYDFQGRSLQNPVRDVPAYEHMTFNLTASDDRSIAVFGWAGDRDGPAYEFARSFLALPLDRMSDAIVRLSFEHFENVFIRESWWNNLNPAVQRALKERARSGFPDTDRKSNCLTEDNMNYFSAEATTAGIVL